jgi:glyoxylase-like metal-dependent hydrolase (beta-lactamase superfamily II)
VPYGFLIHKQVNMSNNVSRRTFTLAAAGAAAAFGLAKPVTFFDVAHAQSPPAGQGVKSFKIGDVQMSMLYDGSVDRPNAAGFVRNASVDDVKSALKAAALPEGNIPNLFTIPLARIGSRTILFDGGTGGQVGAGSGLLGTNLKAAGLDAAAIDTVLVSHFHPDHILGLMDKDTNAPAFPNAELVMPEVEYTWWTDANVFTRLPEARHGLAKRIQAVFPGWKDKGRIKLIGDNVEVAPGIRSISAPGHTPGHTAWLIGSGAAQLIVLADTVTFNPLFLRNPGWQPAFDGDGAVAEASRRKLIERAIADKAMIAAYHFTFPAAGTLAKDGAGYAFSPVA